MKRVILSRLTLIILIVILAAILLSACDAPESRIAHSYTFNPGAAFQTNFNIGDDPQNNPRWQIRVMLVFEVLDENAIAELEAHNHVVRNAVLAELGNLTMPEITTHRNLDELGERIVHRVNQDLGTNIPLVLDVYFTEFGIA